MTVGPKRAKLRMRIERPSHIRVIACACECHLPSFFPRMALIFGHPKGYLPAGVVRLRTCLSGTDDSPRSIGLDVNRPHIVVVIRGGHGLELPAITEPVGDGPDAGIVLRSGFIAFAGNVQNDRAVMLVVGNVVYVDFDPSVS